MKILLVVNTDGALYNFRKPIISALIKSGNTVYSISSKSNYFQPLESMGVQVTEVDFSRHSVSFLKNLIIFIKLYLSIKKISPDIVHGFTHKPAILGTLAARLAGVRKIYVTITGLGTLFTHDDFKTRFLRVLLIIQYRIALRFTKTVFFQNPDDFKLFLDMNLISPHQGQLTNGSGIDLTNYDKPSLIDKNRARKMLSEELEFNVDAYQIVLFPARVVRDKGLFEFYESARILSHRYPDRFIFLHLGFVDDASHDHISKDEIIKLAHNNNVFYLGYKDNIATYMTAADIVALPSYREGVPRSLIEALAMGRAILTTDAPGCRETVVDGWNGYLCAPKSVSSLVEKLELMTVEFCDACSDRSRKLCEEKFDCKEIVKITLDSYE